MAIFSELVSEVKSTLQFREKYEKMQKALDRKAPKVGDMAPDFSLLDIAGKGSVTLSDFRGKKPVALVFGSYT